MMMVMGQRTRYQETSSYLTIENFYGVAPFNYLEKLRNFTDLLIMIYLLMSN